MQASTKQQLFQVTCILGRNVSKNFAPCLLVFFLLRKEQPQKIRVNVRALRVGMIREKPHETQNFMINTFAVVFSGASSLLSRHVILQIPIGKL